MARPSPVPWPGGLVVKKGSKTLSRCLGLTPDPVSSTSTTTCAVPPPSGPAGVGGRAVRTVSVPPSGMAWAALVKRFTKTCCIRVRSSGTNGRPGCNWRTTVIRCWSSWCRTRFSEVSMMTLRSSSASWSGRGLEKSGIRVFQTSTQGRPTTPRANKSAPSQATALAEAMNTPICRPPNHAENATGPR